MRMFGTSPSERLGSSWSGSIDAVRVAWKGDCVALTGVFAAVVGSRWLFQSVSGVSQLFVGVLTAKLFCSRLNRVGSGAGSRVIEIGMSGDDIADNWYPAL